MDRNELVSELLPRLRRLRGPGEGGAGNDAERYWETMPRSNEPAAGFRRPDQPVSERDIRQMAAEPATQFNMNAATAAEGRIKGIEGLVVQLDPERAIEVRERQVKEGVTPTTRSIATEMLETQPRRQQALRRHLEGPPWAGSRKGWIEPGEAATAMAAALRGPARDEVSGPAAAAVWSHVDRDLLEACAVGEDYDAYIRAVAEDRIGAERNGTDEERERAVDREEQRLQEAFAPTLVAATAAVDRGATIGSGVRIGADAVVDWGACIGVVPTDLRGALLGDQEETERQVTTVGTGAHIGTHCQVERGSAVGEHARVGEYGNVRSVGARSTVGRHSWCHGNVGSDSTIGNRTVVHGVGDRSEVGGGCNVGAAIGHDVRIGRDTNINMEADGTAGPKDRERELLITDGSDIGDEVRAPHGWRPTDGPVRIAPETTIGKGVAIPPQMTMPGSKGTEEVVFGPGELTTPEAVARILERAEVPPQVGRDCRIHPTAFVGAGARIGDRTTIHAGAVVQAGAEIGRDSTIKTGASVGIAARIGPRTRSENGRRQDTEPTPGEDA